MIVDPEVTIARANRNAAKMRFDLSLVQARLRLAPGALASRAVGNLKDAVGDLAKGQVTAARENPAKAAAIAGAVGLALLGKPLIGWLRSRDDATEDDDAS